MTCSEVEKVLPEILDGAPDSAFQSAFEIHIKSCPACSELVSDLKLISSEAKNLAESDEPPAYLWQEIARQLRAEGVIREEEQKTWGPVLVPAHAARRWRAWWLAPVAACLVAGGAYIIAHHPTGQAAGNIAKAPAVAAPAATNTVATTVPAAVPQTPAPMVAATKSTTPSVAKKHDSETVATAKMPTAEKNMVEAAPTAEDEQFLSVVSTRAPSMRASIESQLQEVNEDIREVQQYLARNPRDVDARQQLMDAYQKKALLYQIALDRIQ